MEIPAKTGEIIKIDEADYTWLSNHVWSLSGYGYAYFCKGNSRILMHRYILGLTDPNILGDHINGNRLDNRRSNLRVVTRQQNNQNRAAKRTSMSGYRGVHMTASGKWRAQARHNGIVYYLGLFTDPIEAARVYNHKATELFGEFARLNLV